MSTLSPSYTRDFAGPVLAWFQQGPLVTLPIVSLICEGCGQVAPLHGEGVAVARIDGDSRYGYGTYHSGEVCPTAAAACGFCTKGLVLWGGREVPCPCCT